MSRFVRRGAAVGICGLFAGILFAGTTIQVRLLTPISSYSAKPGMPISAALATRVCADGANLLPEGSELRGVVKNVHRVGLGLVHESAGLELEFTDLHLSDGRSYAVRTQVEAIDNARERIDRKGRIHGIRATATISNRFGEHIIFSVLGHPAAMVPLLVVETGLLHFPEPEIEFRRGAEIELSVDLPAEFAGAAPCPLPKLDASPEEWVDLQQTVNLLPYWSYSARQPQPMDLVNLVYVGSRDEVERAFSAAGWTGSRRNSMRAGVAAIRAIAEQGAYSDAPMRTLLLDGEEADFRLQKSLDTFEKRDHLRIWKREGEVDGRRVWASAATRDVGTTFGMHPFGFTHEIQADVDLERDKVVQDLLFTGCVDAVAYVPRPEGVRETGGAYRKGVSTDARVAVVILNECSQPREDFAPVEPFARPGRAVRVIRRVTLTVRNHVLRDNIVYRSADAAHLGYLALRNLRRQARQEAQAREVEARQTVRPHPLQSP